MKVRNWLGKITSVWIGLLVLALVLFFGVFHGFSDISIFFNFHALILVFGGTFAVALLSYPLSIIGQIYDFILYGFLMKQRKNLSGTIYDFLKGVYEVKLQSKTASEVKNHHQFVRDAIRLVSDSRYSAEDAESILEAVKESFNRRYVEDAKVMINISKFPPALGLLGASTGMIQMMMNLGTGGSAAIGAAMAVALTATFWGIALANFVFLPLADYAYRLAEEDLFLRELIINGVTQVKRSVPFNIVVESLCGSLPVADRFAVMDQVRQFVASVETPLTETKIS